MIRGWAYHAIKLSGTSNSLLSACSSSMVPTAIGIPDTRRSIRVRYSRSPGRKISSTPGAFLTLGALIGLVNWYTQKE